MSSPLACEHALWSTEIVQNSAHRPRRITGGDMSSLFTTSHRTGFYPLVVLYDATLSPASAEGRGPFVDVTGIAVGVETHRAARHGIALY